jgi:hypothetical protein
MRFRTLAGIRVCRLFQASQDLIGPIQHYTAQVPNPRNHADIDFGHAPFWASQLCGLADSSTLIHARQRPVLGLDNLYNHDQGIDDTNDSQIN